MTNIQKYFLHPVTALILAYGSAAFVHRYQLLEFPYASYCMFGFVFISFLLLARKYDLILSYMFLGAGIFVFYKAMTIPPVQPIKADSSVEAKLKTVGALVHLYHAQNESWPVGLDKTLQSKVDLPSLRLEYCQKPSCVEKIKGFSESLLGKSPFVVIAKQENDAIHWYVDQELNVYKSNQTGDIQKVLP